MGETLAIPETYFASPERLDPTELARQIAEINNLGAITPIIDSMPDVVMVLNGQRQILYGNKALHAYAAAHACPSIDGLRPGELFSCQQAALAPNSCGTGEACRSCGTVNAILAGLAGQSARLECHITSLQNEVLELRIFASPFRWLDHDYVLVIASDISDQKRRQVLERIFFHDILNTAGGIQGLAEMMTPNVEMVDQLSPMLRSSAESLVHEIKSQRLLLAAENHALEVDAASFSARAQLGFVANIYRHHQVGVGKSIAIDPATVDFSLVSDEAILQRILGNLLKNALEASRPGDTVRLGAKIVAGEQHFWCHNPGCIPHVVQLRIFQRSFSTKGTGRGIGTYSVKLLTERYLGGRVSFTSTLEHGTRFQVVLPARGPVTA